MLLLISRNPQLSFIDPVRMIPNDICIKLLHTVKHQCSICYQATGYCVKCFDDHCDQWFHITCAQNVHCYLSVFDNEDTDPTFVAYCQKHSETARREAEQQQMEVTKTSQNSEDEIIDLTDQVLEPVSHNRLSEMQPLPLPQFNNLPTVPMQQKSPPNNTTSQKLPSIPGTLSQPINTTTPARHNRLSTKQSMTNSVLPPSSQRNLSLSTSKNPSHPQPTSSTSILIPSSLTLRPSKESSISQTINTHAPPAVNESSSSISASPLIVRKRKMVVDSYSSSSMEVPLNTKRSSLGPSSTKNQYISSESNSDLFDNRSLLPKKPKNTFQIKRNHLFDDEAEEDDEGGNLSKNANDLEEESEEDENTSLSGFIVYEDEKHKRATSSQSSVVQSSSSLPYERPLLKNISPIESKQYNRFVSNVPHGGILDAVLNGNESLNSIDLVENEESPNEDDYDMNDSFINDDDNVYVSKRKRTPMKSMQQMKSISPSSNDDDFEDDFVIELNKRINGLQHKPPPPPPSSTTIPLHQNEDEDDDIDPDELIELEQRIEQSYYNQ